MLFSHRLKRSLDAVTERRLPPPTSEEVQLATELRNALGALVDADNKESESQSESERAWLTHTKRLRDHVLNDDPRRFLRWDVIDQALFVDSQRFVLRQLLHLRRSRDWARRWRPAIRESNAGCPPRCLYYPLSSGSLIGHAYHLWTFERVTRRRVEDVDCVMEFGGGYGSMCRLFFNLGFRGKYVIFDLPAFSSLQAYYLQHFGLPIERLGSFRHKEAEVICVSDLSQLGELVSAISAEAHKLFIATWSISETPIAVRGPVLSLVADFDSLLIGYQPRFGEIDNERFFARWRERTTDRTRWHYLPTFVGGRYLIGQREEGRLGM